MSSPTYRIRFTDRAKKDMASITGVQRRRITRAVLNLARDPKPPASRAMKGRFKTFRRLRVGKYRVVYRIDAGELFIFIIRLGSRQDIYKSLLQFIATLT